MTVVGEKAHRLESRGVVGASRTGQDEQFRHVRVSNAECGLKIKLYHCPRRHSAYIGGNHRGSDVERACGGVRHPFLVQMNQIADDLD